MSVNIFRKTKEKILKFGQHDIMTISKNVSSLGSLLLRYALAIKNFTIFIFHIFNISIKIYLKEAYFSAYM